jgi:signal transduction histidine kinase
MGVTAALAGRHFSSMTDVRRQLPEALGAHLRSRSTEFARAWLERLRARLPEAPQRIFPDKALLNHIPSVLLQLFVCAQNGSDPAQVPLVADDLRKLAGLRRSQGYLLDELVQEFRLLRSIIMEAVEAYYAVEGGPPAFAVHVAGDLHDALDSLIALTSRFYEQQGELNRRSRAGLLAAFSRAVTHELRNQASGAVLTLRLCETNQPEAFSQLKPQLARIERCLVNMQDASTVMLSITLSGEEQVVAEGRSQRLHELVAQVVRDLQPLAAERSVNLLVEVLPDFFVDAGRTQLVLSNLIGNAIKYSDPSKSQRWVRVSAHPAASGECSLSVRDNGRGIAAEHQARIFDAYYRGDDVESGDGLGLSLAGQAVAQMGGRLWLESSSHEGSTFCLTLRTPAEALDPS